MVSFRNYEEARRLLVEMKTNGMKSPQTNHQTDPNDPLIQALRGIGKLAVSRKEAEKLLPYSGRTFRRFEQRNLLPRLKGTRRVVYAVSDLVKLVEEMR